MHDPFSRTAFDRDALEDTARKLELEFIALFGSQAGGRLPPQPESDVDVAVRRRLESKHSYWEIHQALSRLLTEPVALDLVMLDRADPLLRWEVMRSSQLLCGDPDAFEEYRLYAYKDFIDSADLRALEHKLFRKKMDFLARQLGRSS